MFSTLDIFKLFVNVLSQKLDVNKNFTQRKEVYFQQEFLNLFNAFKIAQDT